MAIISNKIPAFLGVIGKRPDSNINSDIGLKGVVNLPLIKVYVRENENQNEQFAKYYVSENYFIWTGGITLEDKLNLNEFNIYKADHKFIFIKFSERKLSICTDHYSKIPLLYFQNSGELFFSTSLDLLLDVIGRNNIKTNKDGLLFYYNFGFTSFNSFLFKDIKSLSGGKQIDYENGEIKIKTYFNLLNCNSYKLNTIDENIHLVDRHLLESTESVLNNNYNIGIALSGGVDSGYLAQKIHEMGKTFNAYTIGFKGDYNEFERIDYLSNKLKFKAKKIVINPEEIISNYIDVSKYSSFPVGFNNSILNFIYKQANKDGVNIMFDGDGADRLFLGMNKYLQLQKILNLYKAGKKMNVQKLFAVFLNIIKHPSARKLHFYFMKFNNGFPFYGERKLSNRIVFDLEFETLLNNIALPLELKRIIDETDHWMFFTLFSVYYTPTFFFHTPYELQLKYDIISNPQFWSDKLVKLALEIPVCQKLKGKKTKMVLREAAKLKIDDGYWNLSKIGLQNSYTYAKRSKAGQAFIEEQIKSIKKTEEYLYLNEIMPNKKVEAERLIPYSIWKEQNKK